MAFKNYFCILSILPSLVPLVTCDKVHCGAVAAAEWWVAPGHHGNTEVVVPGRQEVSHSLWVREENGCPVTMGTIYFHL